MKEGMPTGKVVAKYTNGDVYEGGWKEGKPHGKGRYDICNGGVHEGSYVEGKRQEGG